MHTAAANLTAAARVGVMAVAAVAPDVASSCVARWAAVPIRTQMPAFGRQARSSAEEAAGLVDQKARVGQVVEGRMMVQADRAPERIS